MDWGTQQLVDQARDGDAGAYERLFERVAPRVHVYVSLRLGERLRARLDPQDVVQEVLLAAHRGFGGFEPRGENAFNRWLFSIADHRLKDLADFHAAQRRDDRREAATPPGADPRAGPATRAGSAESRARLVAALERLEAPRRDVILLHYFRGHSADELGEALGCTGRHARRLLGEAQEALAARLGGLAADPATIVARALAALDPAPDRERIGPHRVLGVLGHGGLSTVYHARHDGLGREVAIKLLRTEDAPARRRLLEREVQALTRLTHPSIVRVHEVGEHEGSPFLVMDLLPGTTLQAVLTQRGPLPIVAAVRIAWHLALALDHAHRAGVLHRDVKPANIILRPDGTPVLTDFGLATFLAGDAQRLTDRGQQLGTAGYWPPEQARGAGPALGPSADVYALGATLFAMLTGQAPFQRATFADQVRATLSEPAPPPSRLRPEVDPLLDQICQHCLEKEPARRFPDAEGLALALSCWVPAPAQGTNL